MPFIFKVKYGTTLRRMTVKAARDGTPDLTIRDLEAKIRDMFHITPHNGLVMTYKDQDDETVTIGDDFDLYDACLLQNINPLRIDLKTRKAQPDGVDQSSAAGRSSVDAVKNQPICSTMEALLSDNFRSSMKLSEGKEVPCSLHECMQFDKNEQCDTCGTVPATGHPFTSVRKEANHVLSKCCTGHVDRGDRQRYDKSTYCQKRHNRTIFHEEEMARYMSGQSSAAAFFPPRSRKVPPWKQNFSGQVHVPHFKENHHSPKSLDSWFVQHLTFPDGTEVPMGTHFTKSWRLKNTGVLPWPPATQLVCVGGDVLGSQKPSTLQTSHRGLLAGEEIDASIELVAPERPGRFVSYWRLMAPTGQKFGHRIWVVIQAISQPRKLSEPGKSYLEVSRRLPAVMEENGHCMPSVRKDMKQLRVQSHIQARVAEQKELARSFSNGKERSAVMSITPDGPPLPTWAPVMNSAGSKLMDSAVKDRSCSMQTDAALASELDFGKSRVGCFSLVRNLDEASMQSKNREGIMSLLQPSVVPTNSEVLYSVREPEQIESADGGEDHELCDCQEDIILGMLNSMGFTQRALNLELLRKNKNDVQGTVDDLVVASGWDHILDDLEEMGFYNAEMNRRLLSKNNGSIKLVVKELLQQISWGKENKS